MHSPDALIVGAGPAGLMAAEVLGQTGGRVLVAEAKPSAARKFLMAGKSGLNLTKDEPFDQFLSAYAPLPDVLRAALTEFGPAAVQHWVRDLGQEVFTGSSGRVFPKVMKASPLLRAWMGRLQGHDVELRSRWRWRGMADGQVFDTPEGVVTVTPKVTILAMGGASWARLGSDGVWAEILRRQDVEIAPFQPANMGLTIHWSDHVTRHFGKPVKNVVLTAGDTRHRGEFVISAKGLEGSGIYAVSRAVRNGAALSLDLLPDREQGWIDAVLAGPRGKTSLTNFLRKALRLDPVKQALLMEFGARTPADISRFIKTLPVNHQGPRPMDEAISTAGGVAFSALDDGLMLRACPGVFCAGEMLDWEAPTGGYLLTASLATGRHAGQAAVRFLQSQP